MAATMQNPTRFVPTLGAMVVLLWLAPSCNREPPEGGTRTEPPTGQFDTLPNPGSPVDSPPQTEGVTKSVAVEGQITTSSGEPCVGCAVTMVDESHVPRFTTTNAQGDFRFPNASPPYDLGFATQMTSPPLVVLGIHRPNPVVDLLEESAATLVPPTQRIQLAIRATLCEYTKCTVHILSSSPSGFGYTEHLSESQPGEGAILMTVAHSWQAPSVPASERVKVDVLVSSPSKEHYAYATRRGVHALPGELLDLGVVDTEPVPSRQVNAKGASEESGSLDEWLWNTTLSLHPAESDTADSFGGFILASAQAPHVTATIPQIEGATVRLEIGARHPRSDWDPGFSRSAVARTGNVMVAQELVEPRVRLGPEFIKPSSSRMISRRDQAFEWTRPALQGLSVLTVSDTAASAVRYRVITEESRVSFKRLNDLGLAPLALGPHMMNLTTYEDEHVDHAVSPLRQSRRLRHDSRTAGRAARLRFEAEVTP
jgi:hypothetical protein